MQDNGTIFALDIGTRSVVGLIVQQQNEKYEIKDLLAIEHSERAMVDGQIHDVLSVAKVISTIKEQLEEKHGPLEKVCVAAAGRALKTERAKVSVDIKRKPIMQKQDIIHLELSAVQQAQINLATKYAEEKSHHYYCVGYSVMHYHLDGEDIGNLIDQQGDEASVEIIATFLPKIVVESLLSALHRSGLEMEALTLEPIAAINVLIPTSMRRLNVALVDIGAGTSDIAITDEGTVVAYGMVPVAGDEITEAISDEYLLDFPLAEKAKRELYTQDFITVSDILGFDTDVSKEDVIKQIDTAIDRLASSICDEILRLNKKPPKAVMLVGGGSLTPDLPKRVAQKLELPENRVAIRGIDAIQNLELADHVHKGPELVTPIGIAIAANQSPVQYVTAYVNDKPVRLFDIKQLTVGDCLLAAGIKMNKLYGKPGMAIMVKLNNRDYTLPGNHGEPPTLLKNGEVCTLDSVVKNGDQLFVEKGRDGSSAQVQIRELLDEQPIKTVQINESKYDIKGTIWRNGEKTTTETVLQDHDKITYQFPETIDELLRSLKLEKLLQSIKPFTIEINSKAHKLIKFNGQIIKNGLVVNLQASFSNGDKIVINAPDNITLQELADDQNLNLEMNVPVFFKGEKVELSKKQIEIVRNGIILESNDLVYNGDSLQLIEKNADSFIFQDLFRFIDFSIPTTGIRGFKLIKNGEEVTFHEQIAAGDQLDIVF
ncbi:cell division protein FtsA [Bacillus salitolerans]|uniref:Cell division protein FtsA n=1 Tax=Bacillus salitolerans TaxID=1437434 RepID=A0ABW4LWR3_9BACI